MWKKKKMAGLDVDSRKNNSVFISKLIESVVKMRLNDHMNINRLHT